MLEQFRGLVHVDHGLILVTGPTGSGKTTTLYAALQEINSTERNILTLEDPIEYQLDGISQTQVSEKKGMTFASRAAERAAAGPGHHHDRRNPRPRDGRHGDPVGPDGAPRLQHAPHQRRRERGGAIARPRHRTVPARQQHDRRPRPAAGKKALPRVRPPGRAGGVRATPAGTSRKPRRHPREPPAGAPPAARPATRAGGASSSCCWWTTPSAGTSSPAPRPTRSTPPPGPGACATLRDDGAAKVLSGLTSVDEVLRVTMRSGV